ncbi:threonine-phosphate decarboxylase CobD [Thermocoleostomius sinensis]|uniref:threonine-phosphate decarboxylase n=1 Tax=Thermocoleostomius sinensis A174 TaxID=2016057 RepID=A0A9E8ZJ59_9CYAN|nr:threonine-phosphate decarboxylase CobD [Thermocoleostomius sinensis]WAL62712.1 threonine-phosphate decarboxylase CobD [Thermocoleostomius sinensis A174]
MHDLSGSPAHGGNLTWAASLAGCSPFAILDFSASINPLGPPKSAIAAIHSALKALPHYPDPSYQTLRQAIAAEHNFADLGLDADWILPGNGCAELLTWAGRDLADLSATYLLTPAFGDYQRALNAFGATIVNCPLSLASPDLSLSPFFHRPVPAAGLLLNNPHNPSGCLFSVETIGQLLDHFKLVVIDEAFMDFLWPQQQQSLLGIIQDYPNVVILRSLTKFYSLPGLRLGFAVAHPDRLRQWQQWRDPWAVNVLAEAAAIAVLSDRPFQQQTWEWLEEARSQLFQGLAALPGLHPLPSTGNFLLVRSSYSVVSLQQQLLQQHQILIRDCHSFPELGDQYFRVAVRTHPDNQRLLHGLADIVSSYVL